MQIDKECDTFACIVLTSKVPFFKVSKAVNYVRDPLDD